MNVSTSTSANGATTTTNNSDSSSTTSGKRNSPSSILTTANTATTTNSNTLPPTKKRKYSRHSKQDLGFWDTYWLNAKYKKIKGQGFGQLSPPPNHRRSGEEVSAWRRLTDEQQRLEIINYDKLPLKVRQAIRRQVPGNERKRTNPKTKRSTNNSNNSRDLSSTRNTTTSNNNDDASNTNSGNNVSTDTNTNNETTNANSSKSHGFTNSARTGIEIKDSTKRRIRGDRPTTIANQGSKAVQDARMALLKAAATFIQTSSFHKHDKNELYHDNNMNMVLVMVNKVNDSNIRGCLSKQDLLLAKPNAIVMSSRREAIKDTCKVLSQYLKLKDSDDDLDIDWDILLADDSNEPNYLIDTIQKRDEQRKYKRAAPTKGVRTSAETDKQLSEDYGTLFRIPNSITQMITQMNTRDEDGNGDHNEDDSMSTSLE